MADDITSENNLIKECLKTQISEYEMLESMFSNPGEMSLSDYSILVDINDYLNNKSSDTPRQLNYTISFNIECHKLEMIVTLPLRYPQIFPDVFVRSDALNRFQQTQINKSLSGFILNLNKGEVIISSLVFWLQDNAIKYFKESKIETNAEVSKSNQRNEPFNRLWIYSHHIYNKVKRKQILDLAHEYELTGFCLSGKPGIICIEGYASDCEEWWQKVRSMSWKKIMCKHKETFEIASELTSLRKFKDFKEISFEGGKMKRGEYHTDFGKFLTFLKENGCEYVFNDYFGIEVSSDIQ